MEQTAAAVTLGTAEILDVIFSFLDAEVRQEQNSGKGVTTGLSGQQNGHRAIPSTEPRADHLSQLQALRSVNRAWKREADRRIGRELMKRFRPWNSA